MASVAQNQKIVLEPHAVCRQTNAGLTMLFDRTKGVMYELNESASAVVTTLSTEPQSWDEIIAALLDQFDAPREEIETDVRIFIDEFVEAGLLKTYS
jgi:PqqD family protein of HPr-rel-A system